jgi:hypothetical protein
MIFSLDVRRARKGDCLLLHYGTSARPALAMIDGGPASVYKPHLKPRLLEIRKKRKLPAGKPLPVDLLMVSHVDDDHIQGILDLTREEIERKSARQPRLLNVLGFWHNSFDALIGHTPDELTATFTAGLGAAAAGGGGLPDDAVDAVEEASEVEPEERTEVVRSGLKVLASIAQGHRLRLDAEALGFPLNPEFDGKLVMARKGAGAIDVPGGLKLTVAGPMQPELTALHKKHQDWLRDLKAKGKKPEDALAAYVDKSVPNLSSIVVLAEAEGKRMLLTGDARGDKVLKGLELVGLLKRRGKMKVDVLKVPHHGSAANLADDFFKRVVATHYVFSGDGEHGNPEREALEMLFRARKKEPFVVHLTYPIDELDAERKRDWEEAQARDRGRQAKNPAAKVRPDWSHETQSLGAFIEKTGLAPGQEIRIVPKTGPHVIDLLDPVGY